MIGGPRYASVLTQAGTVPLRHDMLALLIYVRDNKVIGTASTGNMPLKAVREFAPLLSKTPKLDEAIGEHVYRLRSEEHVWPIYFLHILAEVGGLIGTGQSKRWKLTAQGESFLRSEPAIQLVILLGVWWHRVNWLVAFPFLGMGDELPHGFSSAALYYLQSLPTAQHVSFGKYADRLIDSTGLVWGAPESYLAVEFLHDSIERMVIDVLAKFEALEPEYKSERLGTGRINRISTFQITPLGRALLDGISLLSL